MGLKENLAAQFPDKYWNHFHADFMHNFFDLHMPRTEEYDNLLRKELAGKKVLEVGGFPGLMVSWLLDMKCDVTTIESPDWFPDWYREWAESKKYPHHVHNIIDGIPPVDGRWDWITISDVLIHMDGIPTDFLMWAVKHSDRVLLSHYPGKNYVNKAVSGTLRRTWDMPTTSNLEAMMLTCGAKMVERLVTNDREILIFGKI
jgi:hypothetical protein